MRSPYARAKDVLDTLVTVGLGVAAVVLVWRALGTSSPTEATGSEAGVQTVASEGLTTSIGDEPKVGSHRAPVVLIEYSDFECPFCERYAAETYPAIEKAFVATGRVQYVFRNFPLDRIHRFALPAAEAARCAHKKDRHSAMREHLIANTRSLGTLDWSVVASTLGLEVGEFGKCMSEHSTLGEIETEKREAIRFGVKSTPTFLFGRKEPDGKVQITGRLPGAVPYELFEAELNRLAGAPK